MGGSGGASYGGRENNAAELRAEARRQLREQTLVAEKNQYLGELLAGYNDRPYDAIRDRLAEIEECVDNDQYEVDRLLFGGSVAKHTYVNGLSDIDSLIFLNEERMGTPQNVLRELRDMLSAELPGGQIESIDYGRMAVTITYRDGPQIQVLPAIERGGHTLIPSSEGTEWKSVRPHKFTEKLTDVNQRTSGGAVPAIKLAKGLIAKLPVAQQLSGYHVEAIAVDAFREYSGRTDRASMVSHLISHAATAIMRPTADITGQTVRIDDHLGPAESAARRTISRAFATLSRQLEVAESKDAYRQVFE